MNILDLTQATNPANGKIYIVISGSDYYIDFDDFMNIHFNQSVRYNSQALSTGANTINFTDRAGQVAFSDANYMVIPYTFDSSGVFTPVVISSLTATGFTVTNSSGVSLTLNYFAIKL